MININGEGYTLFEFSKLSVSLLRNLAVAVLVLLRKS